MQIKQNVKQISDRYKTSRITSFIDKKKPVKLKNIFINYEGLKEEDPLKIFVKKKNDLILNNSNRKNLISTDIKRETDFPLSEQELFDKRKEKTNEYRINKIIKDKYSFYKLSKSSKKDTFFSPNVTGKKFIPIGKMIESEIDFRKKQIIINPKTEKRVTKADIFSNDLINNKTITRNRPNDNLNPLGDYSTNHLVKKKLHFAAKRIYECIITNNPMVLSSFKITINPEIDCYLVYAIDKVYKHFYSYKDNLNIDSIKSLLHKEIKISDSISTSAKNYSSKYTNTIATLDSYNETFTYNKYPGTNKAGSNRFYPNFTNSKYKLNNPSYGLLDSHYGKNSSLDREKHSGQMDLNSSYFYNKIKFTTNDGISYPTNYSLNRIPINHENVTSVSNSSKFVLI
jgi:hypothetical protein